MGWDVRADIGEEAAEEISERGWEGCDGWHFGGDWVGADEQEVRSMGERME